MRRPSLILLFLTSLAMADSKGGGSSGKAAAAAKRAGESIKTLHFNPLDDWRRKQFNLAIRELNRELRELTRELKRTNAPQREVHRVQREIVQVFETSAGRENREVIQKALASSVSDASVMMKPEKVSIPTKSRDKIGYETSVKGRAIAVTGTSGEVSSQQVVRISDDVSSVPVQQSEASSTSTPKRITENESKSGSAFPQPEAAAGAFRQMDVILAADKGRERAPGPLPEPVPGNPETVRGVRLVDSGQGEGGAGEKAVASENRPEQAAEAGEFWLPGVEDEGDDDDLVADWVGGEEGSLDVGDTGVGTSTSGTAAGPLGRRVRLRSRATPQRASLGAAELEDLAFAKGRFVLLTVIVSVGLSLLGFYLGFSARLRRTSPASGPDSGTV